MVIKDIKNNSNENFLIFKNEIILILNYITLKSVNDLVIILGFIVKRS